MSNYSMLFLVSMLVFLINLPLGSWRSKVKKFSLQWFAAIHLSIPLIIALRFYSGIGFELYTYPAITGAYILGQYIGARYLKFINPGREI